MRPFQIFRPGTHTSAAGTTITFTEDDLRAAAAAYNPEVHEAPITVGHPKDNLPAYGWIKGVEFGEEGLRAEAHQVEEAFSEMVQAGRFKKRSASFYTPDSPANPVPGVYYLRHVAFLGAQPPAIKGLKDVAFSEDEGVGEFFENYTTAGLFRRLREFLIGKFGMEDADAVVPSYLVEDLEAAARREMDRPTEPATPAFSETTGAPVMDPKPNTPETPVAAPEAPKPEAPAADTGAEFAEREQALKAREEALAARERGLLLKDLTAQFGEHAAAGRIRPADAPKLAQFAASLDADATIEFGEGDSAKAQSPREFLMEFVAALPKAIEYAEVGANGGQPESLDNDTVASRAQTYVNKVKRDTGRTISFTEAVNAVRDGRDQ
jgi:hypothetical protein